MVLLQTKGVQLKRYLLSKGKKNEHSVILADFERFSAQRILKIPIESSNK